ncbi:zinc finger protein 813-like [Wyeomyia smithii]|uniref:zinc finger protein 813-like n=1 Tax=Wyeomyia smithii TaxID=174621 RepID=UPI0024681003|nr:zinc finger protein 813-like [Wyeomyia smithii]
MDYQRILEKFSQLCRFCLSEIDCVQIFCKEGNLNQQLNKSVDVLLAKVDENDGFPNNICRNCISCIENFVDFEAICTRSYRLLILATKQRCAEFTFNSHEPETAIVETDIECLDEEEQTTINDETSKNINGSELDFVAEDGELSESTDSEQKQLITAAIEIQPSGFVFRGSRKIPLVECIYCKNVYRGKNTLKKHLRIHLNIKDYHCEHCSRSFTDRSSLRIHEGRHLGKSFVCSSCDKSYFSKNELRQHLTMQHLERRHACDICQRKFPSRTILNDHKRVHMPERPFVCKQCGVGFKRNRNLIRHQQLHQKHNKDDKKCQTM